MSLQHEAITKARHMVKNHGASLPKHQSSVDIGEGSPSRARDTKRCRPAGAKRRLAWDL